MTATQGLYQITESDYALAAELKANLHGPHRPDVARLISHILWTPLQGRIVLVCTRKHKQWRLARLSGVRGEAIRIPHIRGGQDRFFCFRAWRAPHTDGP